MATLSENIVLIGMPGVGKSTVGVLLAKSMKRPFIDTDLLVQIAADRFLQEIIDGDGMEAFLDLEARTIAAMPVTGAVIATGGSVVYRDAAMAHLRAHGRLVFLAASFSAIATRLRNIATRGIACQPGQSLEALYQERQPLYAQYADLTVCTDGLAPEDVVTAVITALGDRSPASDIQ
jgi:shikimate kinase